MQTVSDSKKSPLYRHSFKTKFMPNRRHLTNLAEKFWSLLPGQIRTLLEIFGEEEVEVVMLKAPKPVVRVRYALTGAIKEAGSVQWHCWTFVKSRKKEVCSRSANTTQWGRILESMADKVSHTPSRDLVSFIFTHREKPCSWLNCCTDGHNKQTSIARLVQNVRNWLDGIKIQDFASYRCGLNKKQWFWLEYKSSQTKKQLIRSLFEIVWMESTSGAALKVSCI